MRWVPRRLRDLLHHIVHQPPGERFRRYHEHHRRRNGVEHPALRWGNLVVGSLLVATGVVMLVLPGPGILLILIGLIVIASRARRAAHWLDRSETALRSHLGPRFRRGGPK